MRGPYLSLSFSLIALLVCGALPTHAAKVYKWVDSQGVTHYTDTPPPARPADELKLAPPPSQAQIQEAQRRLQQVEEEAQHQIDRMDKEASAKRQEKQKQTEEEQKRQNACDRLRSRLTMLQVGLRVAIPDAKGGYVWLNDAQRQLEIEGVKRQLHELCEK
jgi:Skp family chaperone for outer membrane proteins